MCEGAAKNVSSSITWKECKTKPTTKKRYLLWTLFTAENQLLQFGEVKMQNSKIYIEKKKKR